MIVYLHDDFIPKAEAKISPDDRGFLFADGVYEVLHAYDGHLFKADRHLARLARSLREICIDGLDMAKIADIAATLIDKNDLGQGNAVVYLQITRGTAPRKHAFPTEPSLPTIYATAFRHTVPVDKQEHGVKVILAPDIRWARCDIKSVALLPNVLAHQRAVESDAREVVFVRDGMITEGAITNVCAVFDGTLVTYPRSPYILAGVTRSVVLDLCVDLLIPTEEVPILEHDLRQADELMIVNTTSEIIPVVQVDDWAVADGQPGVFTRALQRAYRVLTRKESV